MDLGSPNLGRTASPFSAMKDLCIMIVHALVLNFILHVANTAYWKIQHPPKANAISLRQSRKVQC